MVGLTRVVMRQPLRFFSLWFAIGVCFVLLVVQQSLSSAPVPSPSFEYADKVGHCLVYFLLMLWFVQLYKRLAHVWLGALCVALGVALEITQGMTGYRFFEVADMAANSAGVLAAYAVAPYLGTLLLCCEKRYCT